jgi:hypothetical protein
MLSSDYEQAASARQWRSLPIFSGRNLVYSSAESGMILPPPSLRHFGEAVAEGVDDEFEPVRDLEL